MGGCTAGICAAFVTNPLDVLRTRLQASPASSRMLGQKRLGPTFLVMVKDGWSKGYMSGLMPNLLAGMLSRGVYLTVYYAWKSSLAAVLPTHPHVVSSGAAFFSTLGLVALINPFYVIRVQVQLQPGTTARTVVRRIWRTEGAKGFLPGTVTMMAGRTTESMLYFVIYEHLKRTQLSETAATSRKSLQFFSLSMASRLLAGLVTYPHNVIETHLREVNPGTGVHDFHGIVSTFRMILGRDGPRGFYSGLTPHLIRVVPNTGITFLVYESTIRLLGYRC
eukprot:NODE_1375_length_981_cov_350.337983_g959_i0.p1 GENE.NODE_1375_length_981_cov_350.337983_g959_i0~~NODE_1375_length_981_cov_350.337983_g959_i0.p1  ORF type:complete len:286 (-),score=73.49 NODE_1375_length_981_cov_350.337983_g959_i0:124-957(-)